MELGVAFRDLSEVAQGVPGPTTDWIGAWAHRHDCYILCPLTVSRGGTYTNEAILIDRQGGVSGSYAKIHPVVHGSEFISLEKGVMPGEDAAVFATDFGRIGVQICFDIHYPSGWAELKRKGAEIVFWPSAYDGGRHLSVHAWTNHYYVVSAVESRCARIINSMGEVLSATGRRDQVIARTLNLDIGLFHTDFNRSQIALIRQAYGPDVDISVYHEEGMFTLSAEAEGLSVDDLVDEFDLDPLDDYIARNEQLQDAWREGRCIPDLTPRYLGREQWA
jgi:predicted amidohydrolase